MSAVLFQVIKAINLTKRLYVVAVTAIAIAPRMPFDQPFSIGGNLSRGFRILLLIIASLNILRNIFVKLMPLSLYKFLMAIESSSTSFLTLLTPFLLRTWMSGRINFSGAQRRDKGLMPWVYLITTLSLTGAILTSVFSGRGKLGYSLWIIKKTSDAISFIPVYQTLRIYNGMTTQGGQYPGRGSILAQIILIAEYYALLAHLSDIFFKIMTFFDVMDERDSLFVAGLHANNHFAGYTRILCHSIMLNVLDETYQVRLPGSTDEQEDSQEQQNGDMEDDSRVTFVKESNTEMIALT